MTRFDALLDTYGSDIAPKLENVSVGLAKANYESYKKKIELSQPFFEERDRAVQGINTFWFNTFLNAPRGNDIVEENDHPVLEKLQRVWLEHDPDDVRQFSINFYFPPDNGFFKQTLLTKTFVVGPPEGAGPEYVVPPYDVDVDIHLGDGTDVEWLSPDTDLVKKAPYVAGADDDTIEDFGSFFNLFHLTGSDDLGLADIFLDWWLAAHEYGAGVGLPTLSDEELDEEEEDDDDRSIDLEEEERPSKRQKE